MRLHGMRPESTAAATEPSAVPLALRLFGPFEVHVNGAPLPRLRSLKGQWLLALLTLQGSPLPLGEGRGGVERAWLAALLWPDSPEPTALANLRCSLKDLRRALGPEAARLRSPSTRTLYLDLTGAAVDVHAFDAATVHGDLASLREAVALYRGPLLERCSEEWVVLERRAREEAYLAALERLAAAALAAGAPEEAARWLRQAVAVDPLRETAQRALMQALAAGGNYAAALLGYRELRQRLHRELNAAPDPETVALFADIRAAGRRAARGGAAGVSSTSTSRSTSAGRDAAADDGDARRAAGGGAALPRPVSGFVGREAELTELRYRVDAALGGKGTAVFLSGEPGIGKTRLATEAATYARQQGFDVLAGRCDEEGAAPYQPFAEAVRQYLGCAGPAQLEAVLPPAVAGELVRIVPQIVSSVREIPPTLPLPAEQARQVLLDAAQEFFATIAAQQAPLLLLLDDLQWADEGSLAVLHHLARRATHLRLLIIGTYRDVELDSRHPLQQTLSALNRERVCQALSLRRLPEAGVGEMILATFPEASPPPAFVSALHRKTEGNPFFIEELLRHLVEEGAISREHGHWQIQPLGEIGVPPTIKMTIGRRLDRLAEESRAALALASVIGQQFSFEVLLQASDLDEQRLLEMVEEWLQAHLVVEHCGAVASVRERFRFQHALLREVLYEALSPRRRARLHERVGLALETVYPGHLDERLEELAHHFARAPSAPSMEKGVDYCLRVGEKAANLYANEAAIQHLTAALELLDGLPADEPHLRWRWEVVFQLQQAYSGLGAFERAQEVLREYLALAERAGCPWGAAAAHYWIAWSLAQPHLAAGIYYSESSHQFRMKHFEQSLRIAEQHGFIDWLGRGRAGIAYRLSLHGAELPRSEALLRATLDAPDGLALEDLQWTCGMLMQVCALQGKWDQVAVVLRRSIPFGAPGHGFIFCLGTMEEALDRAGKQAEFVAICDEAKALFAQAGVPPPLHQWYLQPAVPSEAFRSVRFRDEFDAPELRPEWQWHDLARVSAYSLSERPGHLTLRAGRGAGLRPGQTLSAPRMLLQLHGDFALETKMHGDWDERHEVGSSGLLVWQDAMNFMRLEKFTMNSQYHGSIEWKTGTGSVGRGLLRGEVIHLRLERTGDHFAGLCSTDGVCWLTCGQAIFPMKDPVWVGVAALDGMVAHFEYVRVLGRGDLPPG